MRLKWVHCRPGMMLALRQPMGWMPASILAGLAGWVAGVALVMRAESRWYGLGAFVLSLMGFTLAPLLMSCGEHLQVDCRRGWVHWRRWRWGRMLRENCAHHRLRQVTVSCAGWRSLWRGRYEVALELDHPRLGRVVLANVWRVKRAESLARRLAAALELNWIDALDRLHVALPLKLAEGPVTWQDFDWIHRQPPPPEIEMRQRGENMVYYLVPSIGAGAAQWKVLAYAVAWCLWALTSLTIHCMHYSNVGDWNEAQTWTAAFLAGLSCAGGALLWRTMMGMIGREVIEFRSGEMRYARLWAGIRWMGRPVFLEPRRWIRCIDLPGEETGIWLPLGRQELRVGAGLSSDGLGWMHNLLRRMAY